MIPYKHTVQYYETDKMGITHHSNYIRWMEEARVDFLDQIGWNFARLESEGITSPVVSVECKYTTPTTFSDVVTIEVSVLEFKGVKLVIGYKMIKEDGKVACVGSSSHCFVDKAGRPIKLSKQYPEFSDTLASLSVSEN